MTHPCPEDRDASIVWARRALRREFVILDFETTGLGNDAEAVHVGLLSHDGEPLVNMLVKPTVPIQAQATTIHRITNAMVSNAAPFSRAAEQLEQHMRHRLVIVYNVDFDRGILGHCLMVMGLSHRQMANWIGRSLWHCAMKQYATYCGVLDGSKYKNQKLPEGDHTSIGDCRKTLEVIHKMAATKMEGEESQHVAIVV